MSRKHFSWLLIATLLVGVVVFLLPGKTGKESEFEVQALFPGLSEQVNDLTLVRVIGPGDEAVATLQRKNEVWVVEEFNGYPADWSKLKIVLAALAQANIVEAKTSNSAYFDRLGVVDISAQDSTATLLRLGPDEAGMAVLIGNAAEGRQGQYVRLVSGDRALLIDQQLDLPAEAKDWLNREIIDIADTEVVEVNVVHVDGASLKATKASADDDDFVLEGIPEGREFLSAWSVNNIASALSNLQLDDVIADAAMDFSAASQFSLLTADGLEVTVELIEVDEQHWIRLIAAVHQAGTPATGSEDTAAPEAKEPVDPDSGDTAAEEKPVDELEQITGQRVDEINQRVKGWAFAVPSYKAEVMNKQMTDVLKPLPEEE